MQTIPQMTTMTLPGCQEGARFFGRFRLNAPFFKTGDRDGGVECFETRSLSPGAHGCPRQICMDFDIGQEDSPGKRRTGNVTLTSTVSPGSTPRRSKSSD